MILRKNPLALLIAALFMVLFMASAIGVRYLSSRSILQNIVYERVEHTATSANYLYPMLKLGDEKQAVEHLKRELQRNESEDKSDGSEHYSVLRYALN